MRQGRRVLQVQDLRGAELRGEGPQGGIPGVHQHGRRQGGVKVDLTDPDVVFYVEVRENRAFVFGEYIRCHAGLPVGSQGKVIARVDDERGMVAAWLMMKRGCRVIANGDESLIAHLRRYDPLLKVGDGNPQALGYVLGTSLDELDSVDVTAYDVPVYFPTIGMGDDEVSELAAIIRSGL